MTPITNTVNTEQALDEQDRRLIMSLAINELQTKVSRHESILVTGGEHELPLVERVRNLERYIENTKYWTRLVASALVVQTLAFGGSVIWAAIKLIPLLERLARTP